MDILMAIAVTLSVVGILIILAESIFMEMVGHTTEESDLIFYAGCCLTLTCIALLIGTILVNRWMEVLK